MLSDLSRKGVPPGDFLVFFKRIADKSLADTEKTELGNSGFFFDPIVLGTEILCRRLFGVY